jgi:hypothetical protein
MYYPSKGNGGRGSCAMHNLRVLGFALEESDSIKDVPSSNGNVDHPCKLFALGGHESGSVDDPVVLAATVETIHFS